MGAHLTYPCAVSTPDPAPLDALLDDLERGLVVKVAGGALVAGLAWGALGALVAVAIGWLAPQIPEHRFTWITSVVVAAFALGPCAVLGWWAGFAGGVLQGIAGVAELTAPRLFERIYDDVAARAAGTRIGQRAAAVSEALAAAVQALRARGARVAEGQGGVMAKFRAKLFERLADALADAARAVDLGGDQPATPALRARFVGVATSATVDVFLQQKRRARSLAIAAWGVSAVLAVVALSVIASRL